MFDANLVKFWVIEEIPQSDYSRKKNISNEADILKRDFYVDGLSSFNTLEKAAHFKSDLTLPLKKGDFTYENDPQMTLQ